MLSCNGRENAQSPMLLLEYSAHAPSAQLITCLSAHPGSADMAIDLAAEGRSLLMLGRPGVGKTTAIRELSRSVQVPSSAALARTPASHAQPNTTCSGVACLVGPTCSDCLLQKCTDP